MKSDTKLTHLGRNPAKHDGVVNTPAYRASTITFPTVADLLSREKQKYDVSFYGRYGTPTSFDLEEAAAKVEGGLYGAATSSGMGAIAGTLLACVEAGDHILMVDSVYWPTRFFCDKRLKAFGIETTYYDPLIGAGIADLIRPNTKIVFTESPGSITFEMQDIPAIAEAAHKANGGKGVLVAMDNTWSSPLYCNPFALGVDISVQAGTKYVVGHSDAMLGLVTTRDKELHTQIKAILGSFGYAPGSEEAYLGLRGLRTLSVRLERHHRNALAVAEWLKTRPEVEHVLFPALPDDPGHGLWQRDHSGASGLFGVLCKPFPEENVTAMLDNMALFAMGYSWGGYESLIMATHRSIARTATQWQHKGTSFRLHIGLEDPDDLIADLAAGFDRLSGKTA
ncbi:MAG: cystathionine beta-lyase [Rhodospirillaceae bacterium]